MCQSLSSPSYHFARPCYGLSLSRITAIGRYVGAFCAAWSAFGLLITILFYFPPPRVNSAGLSRKEIIGRVDFVGGFLSIAGLIVFLAGLQWGGYMVCLNTFRPALYLTDMI